MSTARRWLLWPAIALAAVLPAAAHEGAEPETGSDGLEALRFELPAAGSYSLPPIDRVSEHELIDSAGERGAILDLEPAQLALVAFVYLSCSDATGCPLSLASLHRLDRALAILPRAADRVRLVTVSFDPKRDRPAQMAGLRRSLAPKGDWRFFTAPDATELAPVLEDFGQEVVTLLDVDLVPSGRLQHVTKVFLIDSSRRIRNIYSTGFLDHRIVLRDVETLLMESAER